MMLVEINKNTRSYRELAFVLQAGRRWLFTTNQTSLDVHSLVWPCHTCRASSLSPSAS